MKEPDDTTEEKEPKVRMVHADFGEAKTQEFVDRGLELPESGDLEDQAEALRHKKPKKRWKREVVPYMARVKKWWNSGKGKKGRGTLRVAQAQGPLRVLCTIYQDNRPVTSAEGKRSKKESSHGAAKKRAISQLMLKVKEEEGRRLPNLEGYEFRFKILEMG